MGGKHSATRKWGHAVSHRFCDNVSFSFILTIDIFATGTAPDIVTKMKKTEKRGVRGLGARDGGRVIGPE